jgi:hypothetical protein
MEGILLIERPTKNHFKFLSLSLSLSHMLELEIKAKKDSYE